MPSQPCLPHDFRRASQPGLGAYLPRGLPSGLIAPDPAASVVLPLRVEIRLSASLPSTPPPFFPSAPPCRFLSVPADSLRFRRSSSGIPPCTFAHALLNVLNTSTDPSSVPLPLRAPVRTVFFRRPLCRIFMLQKNRTASPRGYPSAPPSISAAITCFPGLSFPSFRSRQVSACMHAGVRGYACIPVTAGVFAPLVLGLRLSPPSDRIIFRRSVSASAVSVRGLKTLNSFDILSFCPVSSIVYRKPYSKEHQPRFRSFDQ